ncbi:MAG: hypothetical protein MHM6MM_004003 [Cercozoa sp. M6MM]
MSSATVTVTDKDSPEYGSHTPIQNLTFSAEGTVEIVPDPSPRWMKIGKVVLAFLILYGVYAGFYGALLSATLAGEETTLWVFFGIFVAALVILTALVFKTQRQIAAEEEDEEYMEDLDEKQG